MSAPPHPDDPVATRRYDAPAGGLGAISSTIKEVLRHPGLSAGVALLARVNQEGGFDCPGCAWPDPPPGERTAFEFCENGAKAVAAEGTRRRVTPAFFAEWSIEALAGQSDHWLEAQGRLTQPMVRRPGAAHYEPLGWEEAFALIAGELRALEHPDQAAFYTSGRTSNEAAFLFQLLARRFGTNNLPDCSNLCHESSGRALGSTLGVGKGTVSLADFERADAVFVLGQNPGTNHPRMLSALQAARRRGAAIVAINPLPERGMQRFAHPQSPLQVLGQGTALSTHYLPVRINGDAALLKGVMKSVLAREARAPGAVLDHAFIEAHTQGFEAFAAALEEIAWSDLEAASGLTRAQIEELADVYCRAEATIICWAMGLTQHKNAVGTIREVVNLLLLRGNLGRPGAGACPVRGHSNVQGDRTVGITEQPTEAFLERLGARFWFEPPRAHGLDVVDTVRALHDGRVRVLLAMGGNFHSATPDTAYTAAALGRARLTAHVSTKLNRAHLVTGEIGLILPCLGRSERDEQASGAQVVSVEDSMSVVHASEGRRPPASEHLRSEPAIVAGIAQALWPEAGGAEAGAEAASGGGEAIDWAGLAADYDRIRDAIEAVVPGFDDYNRRLREPGGFVLPNCARERRFEVEGGRARFSVEPLTRWTLAPDEYLMMTVRSHDQYNTTIYGQDDRYRGIFGGRRVVMMAEADQTAAGLRAGDAVTLTSHYNGVTRQVEGFTVVTQPLPRGCVATYFPEANPLIPIDSVADESNTPTSKSVVIKISRAVSDP